MRYQPICSICNLVRLVCEEREPAEAFARKHNNELHEGKQAAFVIEVD